jgi:hypothetical protein
MDLITCVAYYAIWTSCRNVLLSKDFASFCPVLRSDVLKRFTEEAKKRQAELAHATSFTHGQHYALRELRLMFSQAMDEDLKGQINILEKALRGPITTAIARELNLLRRNNVAGDDLLKSLSNLYYAHRMDTLSARRTREDGTIIPRVICSEAFV